MALIQGQLEKAQFENITGAAASALAAGRVWADITNPTGAVPNFYNGSITQQFQMAASNAIGNISSNTTIDWSKGNVQTGTLFGCYLLTHSNMVANQVYSLILVGGASYSPRFTADNYWLSKNVLQETFPSSVSRKYNFISTPNFKNASYSFGSVLQASILPSGATATVAKFSPNGKWLAVADGTTAIKVYRVMMSSNVLMYLAGPISSPAFASAVLGLDWHPNGCFLAGGSALTPFIQVVPFGPDTGFLGTAFVANPGTLPVGTVSCCKFTPDGGAIVTGGTTTPFLEGWFFNSTGFGSKFSAPGTTPAGAITSIDCSPTLSWLAVGMASAPGVQSYKFGFSYGSLTGFSTKNTDPVPGTLVSSGTNGAVAISPNGDFLAFASTATPFVSVWPVSATGAFSTVLANPVALPSTACYSVCWSPNEDILVATSRTVSDAFIYNFSTAAGGSFGTKIADPGFAVTNNTYSQFHPNAEFLMMSGSTTPYVQTVGMLGGVKNYIAWPEVQPY